MKQKLLYVRATTSVAGSSENVTLSNKQYVVQQNIRQASAINIPQLIILSPTV